MRDSSPGQGSALVLEAGSVVATADGNAAVDVVVRTRDVAGGPLAGRQVVLGCEDANVWLEQPGVTDERGTGRGRVRSTVAGRHAIVGRFVDAGTEIVAVAPAFVTFAAPELRPSEAPKLELTLSPDRAVANGVAALSVRVAATGPTSADLVGEAVQLEAASARDALAATGGHLGADASFTTQLTSTLAGGRTLVTRVGGRSVAASYVFVAGPADPARSRLVVEGRVAGADGTDALLVRVYVADAFDNPVKNEVVRLDSVAAGTTFVPSQAVSDGEGALVVQMRSTSLGDVPIRATFAGPADALTGAPAGGSPNDPMPPASTAGLSGSATFTVAAPVAATSTLEALGGDTVADGHSLAPVRLVLRDAAGHAVAGAGVVLSPGPAPSGRFADALQVVAAGGNVTTADGSLSFAATATAVGALPVVASVANVVLTAAVPFVAGPADAAASTLEPDDQTLVADGVATAELRVHAEDAFGHALAGQPVTLAAYPPNLQFVPPGGGITDANGNFVARARGTAAGNEVLLASVGNVTLQARVRLVPGPPATATSSLRVAPAQIVADGTARASVTVRLRDAHANPTPQRSIVLAVDGAGIVLDGNAGTTDASGAWQATMTGTVAQTANVVAPLADGNLTSAFTLVPGPPDAAHSSVEATPASAVVADGNARARVRVRAQDAWSNRVAGQPTSLGVDLAGARLGAASGFTDANGELYTDLTSTQAGTATVKAVWGAVQRTTTVMFVAGPPAAGTSNVTVAPAEVVADGATQATVRVVARDAFGNAAGNVRVTLATDGNDAVFVPPQGVTAADGSFVAGWRATVAQRRTLRVGLGDVDGVAVTATGRFVAGAVDVGRSRAEVAPSTLVAGGAPATVALRLRDAWDNPVPDAALALAVDAGASLSASAGTSDANGLFAASVAASGAGNKQLRIDVDGSQLSAPFVVVSGAAAAATTTWAVAPNAVVADGNAAAAVRLRLRDAYGNAVAGANVVLTATPPAATTFDPAGGPTDANGVFAADVRSVLAGARTLAAQGGNLSFTVPLQFVAGPADANASTLTATPGVLVADGTSTASLRFVARDAQGNLAAGRAVTFTTDGAGDALQPAASGTTAADGSYVAELSSRLAGHRTVAAMCDGATVRGALEVVAGPVSNAHTTLTATPPAGTVADGNARVALELRAADAYDNPAGGSPFVLRCTSPSATLDGATQADGATGVLDAGGRWLGGLQDTAAGLATCTAEVGGTSVSAGITFVPGPPDAARSQLLSSPDQLVADGNATSVLYVALADAFGNAVDGAHVTLTASGSNNTLNPTAGTTGADGSWSATLAALGPGVRHVEATSGALVLATDVNFVVGSADDRATTLTANPNVLAAEPGATSTLTLTVADAAGSPIAGQAANFVVTGGNAALSPSNATTDANGQVQVTLRATALGTALVRATVGGVTTSRQVTVVAGSPSAARSALAAAPNTLVADGNAGSTLSVQVRDSYDNPVAGYGLVVSVSGGGSYLASPNLTTDASGRAQTTLSAVVAETKQVTAQRGSFALGSNVTFRAGPPSAAATTLVASPNEAVADGNAALNLVLVARDAYGNPVGNASVTTGASVGNVAYGPPPGTTTATGTTDATGSFVVPVRATLAGARQLTATVAGVPLSVAARFVAGPVDANRCSVSASPATVPADGDAAFLVRVRLADAADNPVAQVPLTADVGGGTVDPTTGISDANGIWSVLARSTTAATLPFTAVAAGASGNVVLHLPLSFVAGPPVAARSTLSANAAQAVADGVDALRLMLTVRDAYNNPVPGASVSLQVDGAGVTFAPAFGVTDAAGLFVAEANTRVAGTRTATANVAGQANVFLPLTFVAGPPAASHSTLVGAPPSVVADGASNLTLTATLRDAQDNLVGAQNVTFAGGRPSDAFFATDGTPLAPAVRRSDASGQASANVRGTVAGVRAITASFAGATLTGNFTLVPGAPDGSASSLVVSPNASVADGNQAISLALSVRDAYGNRVAAQAVSLAVTGGNNALDQVYGASDANGDFVTFLRSTRAETKSVTATFGAAAVGASVVFDAGAPVAGQSTLVASPNQVVADGASGSTLLARLHDAFGNACPHLAVRFAADGNVVAAPQDATTNASGLASSTLTSAVAGARIVRATTVLASGGNLVLQAPLTYVAGPPSSSTSTLTISPNEVVADGTSSAAISLAVKDAYGNAVGGQAVALAVSGNAVTLASPSGSTDASGTYTTTLKSTEAGAHTVTATLGATSLVGTAYFVPGAPSAAKSQLTPSPSQVVADGNATVVLTLVVRDAQQNPIPGRAVSLSVGGSNNVLSPNAGTTDASGTFVASLRSTKAQPKAVTANLGGASINTNVTFVPGSPTAQSVYWVADANAQNVVADGVRPAQLVLVVQDPLGNPIPAQAVTFLATGSNVTLSPNAGVSDGNGLLATAARSVRAEAKTVQATVAGITVNQAIRFVAGPPVVANSSLSASPNQAVANGNDAVSLALVLRDAYANLVPSYPIAFASSGNVQVTGSDAATGPTGAATSRVLATLAQNVLVDATFGGNHLTAPVRFVAGAVANATSTLLVSPNVVVADGNSVATLTVGLADAFGNPIVGQAVTLDTGVAGDVFGGAQLTTDAFGTASTTLASTAAGSRTLVAQAQNTSLNASLTFVAGPASAGASSLYANPNVVVADGNSGTVFTLLLRDAFNNPIAGAAVSFSADDANVTFTPSSGTTNASGNLQAQARSVLAGARTAVASVSGTAIAGGVTFVPGPPSAAQSSWTATPSTLVADNNALATLQLVLRDAQRNLIGGQNVTVSTSGTGGTLGGVSANSIGGTTNAAGTFTTTLRSSKAELKTMSAAAQSASLTTQVTFVPGAATSQTVSLVASPTSTVANNANTVLLTLSATDALNNPIVGQPVQFGGTGVTVTLASPNVFTDAAGQANTLLRGTQAGGFQAAATIQNITAQAPVTLVAGPVDANASSFVLAPGNATADGNSAVVASLTLRDAFGNAVAGQNVTFAASGGNNSLSAAATSTDAAGVATTALRSTLAESKTIGASFAGQQLAAAANFVAGPVSNATASFVALGTPTVADGVAAATLRFVGKDARGNPTPGRTVTLSLTAGSGQLGATGLLTDANGVAATTLRGTVAETKTVVLSVDGTSFTANALFVAGSPNAAASSLAASPSSQVADDAATLTLTALVRDAFGNPVPNGAVTLSTSNVTGNDTISPPSGNTDASGRFVATARSNRAEQKTFALGATGINLTRTATFTAGSPNATKSSLAAVPAEFVADNANATTLTLAVRDAFGNAVPSASVTLSSTGTANAFGATSGVTDASGGFVTTLRTTRAEVKTVTAAVGPASLVTNATSVAGSPNATQSSLTLSAATVYMPGSTTARLSCLDVYGNFCAGRPVNFAATANVTVSPASTSTDASGVAQATLSASDANYNQSVVTASCGGISEQATLALTLNDTLKFSATEPSALPAGVRGSFTLTATAANGSVDTAYRGTVTFSSSDAQAGLPANYSFTAADAGRRTFVGGVRARSVGSATLSAADTLFANVVGTSAAVTTADPVLAPVNLFPRNSARATSLLPEGGTGTTGAKLLAAPSASVLGQIFFLGSDDTLRVMHACVTVPNGAVGVGTAVSLQPCTGALGQRWVPGAAGMASVSAPGLCLDATTATSSQPATLSDCNNANTLAFGWPSTSDVFAPFLTDGTGTINKSNDAYSPGGVEVYPYIGQPGFRWTTANELRTYGQMCLAPDGSVAAGRSIVFAACNGSSAQTWNVSGLRISPATNSGLCVSASSASGFTLATCNASSQAQNFLLEQTSLLFQLRAAGSAPGTSPKCLAMKASTPARNVSYAAAGCAAAPNQTFLPQHFNSTVAVIVTPKQAGTTWYAPDTGTDSAAAGTVLMSADFLGGTKPREEFQWRGRNTGDFLSLALGANLSLCIDGSTNPLALATCAVAAQQSFSTPPQGAHVTYGADPSLCLAVAGGNAFYRAPVSLQPCQDVEAQKFYFPYANHVSKAPVDDNNIWMPIQMGGLCLDVDVGGSNPNALLMMPCTDASSQQWSHPVGYSSMQNQPGLCAGFKVDSPGAGEAMVGTSCGASNQQLGYRVF